MKTFRRHKKRTAVFYAVLVYMMSMLFILGFLRTAQKTRQVLYGGKPVLSSVTKAEFSDDSGYILSFGGGEWTIPFEGSGTLTAEKILPVLPPSMAKWMVRTYYLWNHTTERVLGWVSVSAVCW
ncbi:MAG: hypothetical protein IKL87_03795 [Oscillospiraceae bacterium]|nr:hypothetical protein [Oscillospiraceae bacterium]